MEYGYPLVMTNSSLLIEALAGRVREFEFSYQRDGSFHVFSIRKGDFP